MLDASVRADLYDGAWVYVVTHPYDLSLFDEPNTGPFDDLDSARTAAQYIGQLVAGNCD